MTATHWRAISLMCVVAVAFASACGTTDETSVEETEVPATLSAVAVPATTAVEQPTIEDLEREALRAAGLAQVDAYSALCPDQYDAMLDRFNVTGEVMDCQQVGDWLWAVAVAMQEEARIEREEDFVRAVRAELAVKARADREYLTAVREELAEQAEVEARARRQRDFDEGVKRALLEQSAEAARRGEALVARMCGVRSGEYYSWIDPVRVELAYCYAANTWSSSGGGEGGGGGGDQDCEDIGYEHEIDPGDDPYGLDGDGNGIACEGW